MSSQRQNKTKKHRVSKKKVGGGGGGGGGRRGGSSIALNGWSRAVTNSHHRAFPIPGCLTVRISYTWLPHGQHFLYLAASRSAFPIPGCLTVNISYTWLPHGQHFLYLAASRSTFPIPGCLTVVFFQVLENFGVLKSARPCRLNTICGPLFTARLKIDPALFPFYSVRYSMQHM